MVNVYRWLELTIFKAYKIHYYFVGALFYKESKYKVMTINTNILYMPTPLGS